MQSIFTMYNLICELQIRAQDVYINYLTETIAFTYMCSCTFVWSSYAYLRARGTDISIVIKGMKMTFDVTVVRSILQIQVVLLDATFVKNENHENLKEWF